MSESKDKVAASLSIHNAAKMTPKGRMEIAKWLTNERKRLLNDHANYSARFIARYWYVEK